MSINKLREKLSVIPLDAFSFKKYNKNLIEFSLNIRVGDFETAANLISENS